MMSVFSSVVQAKTVPHASYQTATVSHPWYLYSHHQQTTSTPAPAPTATPTTTPTTTPTPTTSATPTSTAVNLAPIPGNWDLQFGTNPKYAYLDNLVLYNGAESIRIEPDYVGCREINYHGIACNVGDHIVFSCWIKTDDSSMGNNGLNTEGARIGIDFYTTKAFSGYSVPLVRAGSFVPWGTHTWTKLVIDVIVPSGYSITGFIPWMQVLEHTDTGNAWYANTQLYINP